MPATRTTTAGEMARLGRLVRLERTRLGLRQDDLARAAGVSRNTITSLEAGQTRAPKTLPAVLAAVGLDATDLLVDSAPTTPGPGAAPPLAHLSDAQLGNEAMRLLAEMTARLSARPVATNVPTPGARGTISAHDRHDEQHDGPSGNVK